MGLAWHTLCWSTAAVRDAKGSFAHADRLVANADADTEDTTGHSDSRPMRAPCGCLGNFSGVPLNEDCVAPAKKTSVQMCSTRVAFPRSRIAGVEEPAR